MNASTAESLSRQTVKKLKGTVKISGHLPEKNFIQAILKAVVLIFSQSVVVRHLMRLLNQTTIAQWENFS